MPDATVTMPDAESEGLIGEPDWTIEWTGPSQNEFESWLETK